MNPDQEAVLLGLGHDVGTAEQHLTHQRSPVVLGAHAIERQTAHQRGLGAEGQHRDGVGQVLGLGGEPDVSTSSSTALSGTRLGSCASLARSCSHFASASRSCRLNLACAFLNPRMVGRCASRLARACWP